MRRDGGGRQRDDPECHEKAQAHERHDSGQGPPLFDEGPEYATEDAPAHRRRQDGGSNGGPGPDGPILGERVARPPRTLYFIPGSVETVALTHPELHKKTKRP